jgi:hypothetical protein
MKETQNAQFNTGFFTSFGKSGAHIALLGDPTLRAHIVAPPSDLTLSSACGKVTLTWSASSDAEVVGYHIYRSFEKYGAYTRLTTNAISATSFTDDTPVGDTLFYQVRAVKLQTSPGGGTYWNTSTGAMASIVYVFDGVTANYTPVLISCDGLVTVGVTVSSGTPPYQYLWSNGDTTPVATYQSGLISVTVTDASGCTLAMPEFFVSPPPPLVIDVDVTDASAPGASDGSIILTISGGNPPFTYFWSNDATTKNLVNIPAGVYTLTITDIAGCTSVWFIEVKVVSGTSESAVFQELSLSPNPTNDLSLLSIKLHKSAPVRMVIHDAAGRSVFEKLEITASELALPLDLRASPPGVYTIFIFVEEQVFTRKLAVMR